MVKVVIAATEAEMRFLARELQCRPARPALGCGVHYARRRGSDIHIIVCGPGIANAAAATGLAVERYNPGHIFNIGVCGVFSEDSGLLTRVVAGVNAVFAEAGVEADGAFLPLQKIDLPLGTTADGRKLFNIIMLSHEAVPKHITRAEFATVSASSGGSTRAELVRQRFKIGEHELLCEDMESAAVGLVALKAALPCTVLRGISNLCGECDHANWKLAEAAEAAQQELLRIL